MWGLIGKRLEETFRGDGNVSFLDRDLYACAETQQKYTYFKKIYTKKWNIYAHFSLLMMLLNGDIEGSILISAIYLEMHEKIRWVDG